MLTDPFVKTAKPMPDKTQTFPDGDGLCLYVEPSGSKRWRFRYQFDGKRNLLSLGIYPEVTLKEARNKRAELKMLIKQGINPSEHRKQQRATPEGYHQNAFELVAKEWFDVKKNIWSDNQKEKVWRWLEKELYPYCGKKNIAEISAPEVLKLANRIKERGSLETAHRVKGIAGQVFRYGVATGRCERDPTRDLTGILPPSKVKHMASFTDPADVKKFLQSFGLFKGEFQTLCALKLGVLWFVRPGELRTAKWRDFDLESKEWRYVVSKTNTPHIVPLATQAVEILKELQPLTGGGEYIFSITEGKPMSAGTINKAIRQLGWCTKTQFTGHGVRAMARTLLAERLKMRPEIIEHQLAHRVPDALGTAYNRTKFLDDRKVMMQAWADYIDELKAGARVIQFCA